MAVEKTGDVSNAAVSQFESLVGSVKSPLTLVERSVGNEHGLLDSGGVGSKHDGFLARLKTGSPNRLVYQTTSVPKRPNGTVIKFQMLTQGESVA